MSTCTDSVEEASTRPTSTSELTQTSSPGEVASIGMVGLSATGQGMAASLLPAGFAVNGFDMNAAAISKFASFGPKARVVVSAADALKNAAVVTSWSKIQHKLTIYCLVPAMEPTPCLTIPSVVRILETKLQSLGRGTSLLDAPVSGGVARAANGTLASRATGYVWLGQPQNLHTVQGGYRRGFVGKSL
ncbi:hypothetical protein BM221_004284 [Beauveria bassiana]|uniref:6-phosphogluconate dehydrogenase NADP-binding domain-containing protein n=1 Tax=Beauveria bassiana TaxID=176275 RepID=A0A2N6NQT3_BEABA|nr:hypothetical protein BM221_004284 [Beauveria bassiana]